MDQTKQDLEDAYQVLRMDMEALHNATEWVDNDVRRIQDIIEKLNERA